MKCSGHILYIFVTLLTLLCSKQSAGQEICDGNQKHYMKRNYILVNESYTVTTAIVTAKKASCNFFEHVWGWITRDRCNTKYRMKFVTKTIYRQVPKVNDTLECCHGYIKIGQNCSEGCKKGKYGENCTQNCLCSNQELFCDKNSGTCLCPAGFTGKNCTDECEEGFFGSNCTNECACKNNSTCNRRNGLCNCTSPGWVGDSCDKECANETYGLQCKEKCSCNENETCDHVTGECTCKPGWKGNNCSQECEGFTFGIDCNENCTCKKDHAESCDRVTGECLCRNGYMWDCSEECPAGWYGKNCNDKCSAKCTGTTYCNPFNGSCICISRKGVNCSEECDDGYYGPNCEMDCQCNTSHSNRSCSTSGQCVCPAGWTNSTCEQECPPGLFGPNCEENCSEKCTGTTHCDRFNGTCICVHSKGVNCTEECDKGYYGNDCMSICQCGNYSNSNGSCDSSGNCLCKYGWEGPTCENENKETATVKQIKEPKSFIEQNLLYIVIAVISVLLLVVALVIAFCCRRITSQKRDKKNRELLNASVQENPSYSSCNKETIPLEKSEQKVNMYEDAVLENETSSGQTSNNVLQVNKAPENMNSNHMVENSAHACAEINMTPDNIEDEYSVPDKGTDKKEHTNDGEHLKGGKPHQTEELYDSTQDNVITTETAPNEYNTFQDVIKLQQEATRKESDSEEDYDVITRTESHKTKPEDLEHYSSFEQVRKLTRQDSLDEEETYNALNEHLSEHRSALVNDSQYHHISLKDKTIDGKTFTVVAPHDRCSTQRQISSGKKLSKQRSLQDSDAIHEEHEEEEMAAEINLTENKTKSKAGEMLEEDITEVIYDECDLDDMAEEHNSERSKLIPESVVESESNTTSITEIVYEECDEPGDEQSRPPSAVVYEDVDEEEDSKHESEDEEAEENQDPVQNKPRPHVKRAVDRRREDYEDFAL
ncbi:multiple epidermal growth factor-like domains protein 10 isoform X2 [Mercenaria mercenaria]|uniref:multiple epidermal growth factor-like domains protein 10 isoform X2 n=1 Tax=Mercenaria mercenaria TaxID=6596 RepID=UPI00234F1D5C|nr:multiple epidermal growth factor-like domains protein 10 isoform X2 [Mercenaria mercenaria]